MSEHREVYFTDAARKEYSKVAVANPERYVILEKLLEQVVENGWQLSTKSRVIKVLRNSTRIAEVRDVGSGGYRMFLFWHDTHDVRELWVCRVLPKKSVEGDRRLNRICDSIEVLRNRFLKENR